MKEYPKVPRYNLPIVEEDWFTEDAKIIEKYDGSNFRFGVYDERYSEYYEELEGGNGDWLIGTSSVPKHESDVDDFDKSLKIDERLEYLRENVSKDKLLDFHSRYNSPITVFCENMVRHTISYDDGIPPLIVFDVYVPRYDTDETISSHPYNREFSGFVDWDKVVKISNTLGLVHARHIDTGIRRKNVNPDMIGESEYADGRTAEGYIIRNDEYNRRIKVRSPEFLEMNKKIWGNVVDEDDPIEKQIAYKYATTNRIRKKVIESLRERKLNEDTLDFIVSITVDDIWIEEWSEITNKKFNPFDLYSYVGERVKGTLSRPNLFSVPDKAEDVVKSWKFNDESDYIPQRKRPINPEQYILSMITNDVLREFSDKIVDGSDKEEGNWIIEPLTRNLRGWLWNENLDSIKCIDKVVDFQSVTEQLYDITVPYIKTRYS